MEPVFLACKIALLVPINLTASFVILDFTLSMERVTILQCRIAYFIMALLTVLCVWLVNQDFICQEEAATNAKDAYYAAKLSSVFQSAYTIMFPLTMPVFPSNYKSSCFGLFYF